ncbi:GTP-binding protein, partial [Methanomassiliicoccus luminyensis]|uniref:GTP-binding protein n=1 Tax=Methanomassiliicoccus luminyensis TaxID=1080712 RepID=UPI00373AEF5F
MLDRQAGPNSIGQPLVRSAQCSAGAAIFQHHRARPIHRAGDGSYCNSQIINGASERAPLCHQSLWLYTYSLISISNIIFRGQTMKARKFMVVSGFLGAGKTTSMIAFAEYFNQKYGKAVIIVNDLGAKNLV